MEDLTLAERLERTTWAVSWMPDHVRIVDRPELLFAACDDDRVLFNTVMRCRAEDARLPELIAEVGRAHLGVASRWMVFSSHDETALESELAAAGYQHVHDHVGFVVAVDTYQPRNTTDIAVRRVNDLAGLDDYQMVLETSFGKVVQRGREEMESSLADCADPTGWSHRFVAYDKSDAPISAGGINLDRDLGFGHFWSGCTLPQARCMGAYSAVVAARIAWARQQGVSHVGIYARQATSAPIVAKQGFEAVSRMTYWQRPAHGGMT